MRTERHLVNVIVNNQTDDLMPLLMDYEKEKLSSYEKVFWDDVKKPQPTLNRQHTTSLKAKLNGKILL